MARLYLLKKEKRCSEPNRRSKNQHGSHHHQTPSSWRTTTKDHGVRNPTRPRDEEEEEEACLPSCHSIPSVCIHEFRLSNPKIT